MDGVVKELRRGWAEWLACAARGPSGTPTEPLAILTFGKTPARYVAQVLALATAHCPFAFRVFSTFHPMRDLHAVALEGSGVLLRQTRSPHDHLANSIAMTALAQQAGVPLVYPEGSGGVIPGFADSPLRLCAQLNGGDVAAIMRALQGGAVGTSEVQLAFDEEFRKASPRAGLRASDAALTPAE